MHSKESLFTIARNKENIKVILGNDSLHKTVVTLSEWTANQIYSMYLLTKYNYYGWTKDKLLSKLNVKSSCLTDKCEILTLTTLINCDQSFLNVTWFTIK
jgi:hypothetical protein